MIKIRSTIQVNAPIERCFQLRLNAALRHEAVGRAPVAGKMVGMVGLGDRVTWPNGPFGWGGPQEMVVEALRPDLFVREVSSAESEGRVEHDQHFAPMNDGTRIRDEINFSAPRGLRGRLAERFFLRGKIAGYLKRRNEIMKRVAESEEWRAYLDEGRTRTGVLRVVPPFEKQLSA